MKYYVTADPHGFYTELHKALDEKGFFADTEPHKLIICGDLFDRGKEALKMQDFILDLMNKDQVILVRGNHEDLAMDLVNNWVLQRNQEHHWSNGTIDTICQLTGRPSIDVRVDIEVADLFAKTPYISKIIPAMVDYFETEHYIFVHGWIPCLCYRKTLYTYGYKYQHDWRKNSNNEDWILARWHNGMDAAHDDVIEPDKTIVCGHYHTSYGHYRYEHKVAEYGDNADYSPYYANGIIALDGCTALSGKVNCIVIED